MLQMSFVRTPLMAAAMVCAAAAFAHADGGRIARPAVPTTLEVDAAFRPFLLSHADGTQNYVCLPAAGGVAWTLVGPQATLFNDDVEQVATHYLSPNPQEAGVARATWRHSRDTSTVWAKAVATATDAAFVAPGAIPWLKLQIVGRKLGPDGGGKLAATTFMQRINTAGGVAPATGCASTADIGARAFVPYAADYVFYR